ncbi:unnamed protein product [Paramecium primaurelia]|uniref:Transmembrane protein n=1 Tax=Paramecium primaurelia TaxID=5886 RepID=A0A8S1LY91_PARPR|nr:unnamed protein product [Paramecium primaurelia]
MNQVVETFQRFDIFGQEIRLLATGKSAFRTNIGAFMTLTLLAILAYSCNSFILEMNKGKNAILNSKEAVISGEEGYTFNSSELIFAVGLLDNLGQPIPNENNRVFTISFYYCNKSLTETECVSIPGTICGNRIKEVSIQLNIPKEYEDITYCMDEEYIRQNPEIRIQGSTRQDNFTLLGALVQRCQNSTEYNNCASNDDIDQYIKNANLYYSYSFHQFNKELDDSPYENAQSIDVTPIYYKVRKYIKIYFQYSQSYLEYNPFYFFPSYAQYDGFEYLNSAIDSALNFEDDSSFAQIEINLDAKKRIHFITYQTLMDVAAKIGGFFTIIRIIFDIALFPIQSILYRLYLINYLTYQQNYINNNNTNSGTLKNKSLTFYSLIKSGQARQLYLNQSLMIDKYLDITEILINPLRFTRQVEDLYGSIKRFDIVSARQNNININQEIDELVANNNNNELIDLKSMSPRTINQEIQFGSLTNFKVPKFHVN